MLGHMRLHEEDGAGGIDAASQKIDRHARDPLLVGLWIVLDGQGVQVDDADDAVMRLLHAHPILHRAHVIAQVQATRGLDAAEDTGAALTPGPSPWTRERGGRQLPLAPQGRGGWGVRGTVY